MSTGSLVSNWRSCYSSNVAVRAVYLSLVNPQKEWHGKTLRICLDEPPLLDHVRVESLEAGEESPTKLVYPQQMPGKDK